MSELAAVPVPSLHSNTAIMPSRLFTARPQQTAEELDGDCNKVRRRLPENCNLVEPTSDWRGKADELHGFYQVMVEGQLHSYLMIFVSGDDPKKAAQIKNKLPNIRGRVITDKSDLPAFYWIAPLDEVNKLRSDLGMSAQELTENDAESKLRDIIRSAMQQGCSDIHLIAAPDGGFVQFRVDTELVTQDYTISMELMIRIVARMYNYTGSQQNDSQWDNVSELSCRTKIDIDGVMHEYRFQSGPNGDSDGVWCVLRAIAKATPSDWKSKPTDTEAACLSRLAALGFSQGGLASISYMVRNTAGLVLLAGKTNAGKTVTITEIVNLKQVLTNYKLRVATIEDPLEISAPHVIQMPVTASRDDQSLTELFKERLEAIVRKDADVLVVGEIRNLESLEAVARLVFNGHFVIASMHVNSALAVPMMMSIFGLDNRIISNREFLKGIIWQRLLPRVCKSCGIPLQEAKSTDAHEQLLARLNGMGIPFNRRESAILLRNPDGCSACNHRGIKGKIAAMEIFTPSMQALKLIQQQDELGLYNHWRDIDKNTQNIPRENRVAGVTALDRAIDHMLKGIVSPTDVELALGPLNAQAIHADGVLETSEFNAFGLPRSGGGDAKQ
ncbi:hypothetical protein C4K68_20355 [Pokkaliibacter plantistimulans]|uniref:Bacterial type II secretion system protein E domain-containing protein n=1 Tax=Proteobacteria bacterium 228 TaxID=2083153 RepID=A0A2S5KLR7_9PROT|nr:ATPase, T2SS/T4P/T4SS family [Pokkaliibacter plantistimulans]PPC75469.1 hypothetical protein C4K68_20355 [Pokkaliibacter plantistimulans]